MQQFYKFISDISDFFTSSILIIFFFKSLFLNASTHNADPLNLNLNLIVMKFDQSTVIYLIF